MQFYWKYREPNFNGVILESVDSEIYNWARWHVQSAAIRLLLVEITTRSRLKQFSRDWSRHFLDK